MIVVSDTSPLSALLAVGQADILLKLFDVVIIPEAVRTELSRAHPDLPEWLRSEAIKHHAEVTRLRHTVDLGEAEAIELAKELRADRLLIDERKGRNLAAREGVPVIGLPGVVLLAKRRRLIPSARDFVEQLQAASGIYLADELKNEAFRTVGE